MEAEKKSRRITAETKTHSAVMHFAAILTHRAGSSAIAAASATEKKNWSAFSSCLKLIAVPMTTKVKLQLRYSEQLTARYEYSLPTPRILHLVSLAYVMNTHMSLINNAVWLGGVEVGCRTCEQ